MRSIKTLSLIALAAVAAMAFIGAGTASAKVHKTVLCKVKQDLCTSGNLWGSHVTIKALSKLAGMLGTVVFSCHSDVTILAEVSDSDRILGKITSLTWSNCTGCKTVTTLVLPTMSIFPTTTGNGEVETTSPTTLLLSGCPFDLHCTALISTAVLNIQGGTIGGTGLAEANEVPTVNHGPFCGSGKWDAGPGASEPYIVTEVNGSKTGSLFVSKESHT